MGKNFPDAEQIIGQKGNGSGGAFALPVGSIPCTPKGVCGLTGAVAQWTKTKDGNKYIVRGQGAGSSPEYQYIYERDPFTPDTKEAGVRCVINSDKPMSVLKATAEKNLN